MTVLFRSILFGRPKDAAASVDPPLFAHLNLDQVFAAVSAGREEYDLTPFFSAARHDVQAVDYRHQILPPRNGGLTAIARSGCCPASRCPPATAKSCSESCFGAAGYAAPA
jgi:hypothetical protein